MRGLRRVLDGVVLGLLTYCGTVRLTGANASPTLGVADDIADDKCWVYNHLNKSGGTTVKTMLQAMWGPRYVPYNEHAWRKGDGLAKSVGDDLVNSKQSSVIVSTYAEALRRSSAIESRCKWFTLFRHPIPRMVSAYYFCKTARGDQLCASSVLDAREVDLATFAKHWGNFGTLQFILSFVSISDVMTFAKTTAVWKQKANLAGKRRSDIPGWYLLKLYMDSQERTSTNDTMSEAALYAMLQPVQDLLRDKYTAVGILEKYNATLSLFNAALGMPGMDWHDEFLSVGQQNTDDIYKDQKVAALEEAWTNSELKSYMQLDLLLYEHAVDIFHQQTRAYDI